MSGVFERQGVGYHETEIAPHLFAFSIDPQRALEEYLLLQIKIRPLYDLLFKNRIFTYFAAATPGLRELVTIGKVWELAQLDRRVKKGGKYDLVIVDAPATGHGLGLLRTPEDLRRHRARRADQAAGRQRSTTSSPTRSLTGVCAVAWPEEMPVNETLDLQRRLDDRARHAARPDLHERHLSRAVHRRRGGDAPAALRAATPSGDGRTASRSSGGRRCGPRSRSTRARDLTPRAARSGSRRARGQDVVELPFLFEPQLDMDAVERLADTLEESL